MNNSEKPMVVQTEGILLETHGSSVALQEKISLLKPDMLLNLNEFGTPVESRDASLTNGNVDNSNKLSEEESKYPKLDDLFIENASNAYLLQGDEATKADNNAMTLARVIESPKSFNVQYLNLINDLRKNQVLVANSKVEDAVVKCKMAQLNFCISEVYLYYALGGKSDISEFTDTIDFSFDDQMKNAIITSAKNGQQQFIVRAKENDSATGIIQKVEDHYNQKDNYYTTALGDITNEMANSIVDAGSVATVDSEVLFLSNPIDGINLDHIYINVPDAKNGQNPYTYSDTTNTKIAAHYNSDTLDKLPDNIDFNSVEMDKIVTLLVRTDVGVSPKYVGYLPTGELYQKLQDRNVKNSASSVNISRQ